VPSQSVANILEHLNHLLVEARSFEQEWNESALSENSLVRSSNERAGELLSVLEEELRQSPSSSVAPPSKGHWVLGSTIFADIPRPIHGGYLTPKLRVPIIETVPPLALAFLMKLPDGYILKPEIHGANWGWHYHYLDRKQRRSDHLLSWDTRTRPKEVTAAKPEDVPVAMRGQPLFGEEHAEKDAEFAARPDLWGAYKKQTMHTACSEHLAKRGNKLEEFRCASSKAFAVWPMRAVLTPHPNQKL
jgi:hypothetical protein